MTAEDINFLVKGGIGVDVACVIILGRVVVGGGLKRVWWSGCGFIPGDVHNICDHLTGEAENVCGLKLSHR